MADQLKQNEPNRTSQTLDEASLKRVIEALIFASDKPLSIRQLKDILGDIDPRDIRKLINELREEYAQSERSFEITEVAGGFQFSTIPAYGRWLKKLYKIKQSDYLTGPSLETVAIIAYRQPVAKADIEFIRGVSVDGVINNLLEKGLIRIVGRKEVIGRPFLYGTTSLFLQYFGLNSIEELPALSEFRETDLEFKRREVKLTTENEKGDKEDGEAKKIAQEDRPD